MGVMKGMFAVNDTVTYRVSIGPRFNPDPSAVEEALKSPEAVAILGVGSSVRAMGRGSFIEVVVSKGNFLSDEQTDALGKILVSLASKKAPASP